MLEVREDEDDGSGGRCDGDSGFIVWRGRRDGRGRTGGQRTGIRAVQQ